MDSPGARPCRSRRRRLPTGWRRRSVAVASSPRSSPVSCSAHSADAEARRRYLVDELGGLANAVTFIVFGAAIVGPVLAGHVESSPVRRAQPHGRAHGAGGAFAPRYARPVADARVRRLVRPARSRVDRLHGHRARGRRPPRLDDHDRRRAHDRPLRLRPRSFGEAVDGSLCKLVPGAHARQPAFAWKVCTRHTSAGGTPPVLRTQTDREAGALPAESVSSSPDDALFVRPRLARRVAHTASGRHATSKHRKGAGVRTARDFATAGIRPVRPKGSPVRVTDAPTPSPTLGLG